MSDTGTVSRALAILTAFAEHSDSMTVTELATTLELPMSTAHRLLDLMIQSGFVEKDTIKRRYRIGFEFFRVANLAQQKTSYAALVQPLLDRIAAASGETAIFASYNSSQQAMMYAAKSDSRNSLRFRVNLFQKLPVEWGASGMAILAFLSRDVQREIQRKSQLAPVAGRKLSAAMFAERVEAVRRNGYALSESEQIPDSVGVAVPLIIAEDQVAGSIALTIPKVRFDKSMVNGYVELIREQITKIGNRHGMPSRSASRKP